jgi:hypothetical protein
MVNHGDFSVEKPQISIFFFFFFFREGSKIRTKVLDPSGMFEMTLEDFTLHRVVTISHSDYAIR